jgi:hypothetical protein
MSCHTSHCHPSGLPQPNNECCTEIPEFARFAYSSAQSAFANAQNAQQSAEDAAATLANVVLKSGDTMTGGLVIDVNSPNTALRVTQQGTGIAFIVEDEIHPDATPFQIDASGNLCVGTTTPIEKITVAGGGMQVDGSIRSSTDGFGLGIGYTTGAGGTVTQVGTKSDPVTLHKPTGRITTAASSISANSSVDFVLFSDSITAGDIVLLNFIEPIASFGSYLLMARTTSNGAARILIRNLTGSPLAEVLQISYVIIKASTT